MRLSAQCMLLSFSAISLPALAQESGAGFENFLLSSPSIVSPSQYYQVRGGRFEALGAIQNGSVESKVTGTEQDSEGQSLAVGYNHALSRQLVLGADLRYLSTKLEATPKDSEDSSTEIRPNVAFSLTPIFTLGASVNILNGDVESSLGDDSYNATTFTVGGTLHREDWEATLAYTTVNEDDEIRAANLPQTITVHGRYKFLPVLALGLRYAQADYADIEPADANLETESSYAVILESAFSDTSRVEVAFLSTSNSEGDDGDDETDIFLSGGFDLAPNLELGAQVRFSSAESDAEERSENTFALTLSMAN